MRAEPDGVVLALAREGAGRIVEGVRIGGGTAGLERQGCRRRLALVGSGEGAATAGLVGAQLLASVPAADDPAPGAHDPELGGAGGVEIAEAGRPRAVVRRARV